MQELAGHVPALRPVQNNGQHGFGRAVVYGIDHSEGDAVVIMMADESDDCRDVVRYWELLGEGYDAVFGSRFVRGGGVIDYPAHKLLINRMANLFLRLMFHFQSLSAQGAGRLPAIPFAALQSHGGTSAEDHRARIFLDGDAHYLAESAVGYFQIEDPRDGQPLPFHRTLLLAGKILQRRGL